MVNLKERLAENEQKAQAIGRRLQALGQERQNLLQELLRNDGEHRLLVELQKEAGDAPLQPPNP